MYQIVVTVEGESPLLCHKFSDSAALDVERGTSTKVRGGQNTTPRESAADFLYLDSQGKCVIPGMNFAATLVNAGVFIKQGKSQLTTATKSLVPAGILVLDLEVPVIDPRTGTYATWEVDSRPIVNQKVKARRMCHRPRFDSWSLTFRLQVDDRLFKPQTVRQLVDDAGLKVGLCAFSPRCRGPFGRFKVTKWDVKMELQEAA